MSSIAPKNLCSSARLFTSDPFGRRYCTGNGHLPPRPLDGDLVPEKGSGCDLTEEYVRFNADYVT